MTNKFLVKEISNIKSIKILGYFLSEKNVIIQYVKCSTYTNRMLHYTWRQEKNRMSQMNCQSLIFEAIDFLAILFEIT